MAVQQLRDELDEMKDVLMGRVEPPIDKGVMTLQEVADAYYSRAAEITIDLHRMEADGHITKGDPGYKFRTGELRMFTEMCKRSSELGSRRLTYEQMLFEARFEDPDA